MLFNSPVFAAFFVIVLAGYYALRPARLRILWILAASYVFYGWLSPLYPALLAYATLVSYVAARAMASSRRKKAWLALAVVNGIVMLGAAKYGAFLAANLNGLLEILGIEATVKAPGRLFPVGISFYTMLIIGYVMDVYRGKVPAEKDVVRYATMCVPASPHTASSSCSGLQMTASRPPPSRNATHASIFGAMLPAPKWVPSAR